MYKIVRPLLFKLSKDPETVHHLALSFLKFAGILGISAILKSFTKVNEEILKQKVFGLEFINPLGLAGGFDKDAVSVLGLQALGFGFLEVGTITRYGQPGNPRPRIVRLLKDEALINRMGFNNKGADALANKLKAQSNLKIPIGISLGKSKITPLEQAAEDYLYSFEKLYNKGDYFVVNVSSPNTPGLRQLQNKNYLTDIFLALDNYRQKQSIRKPILVKIAPDLSFEAINEILEICQKYQINGIIATNTSLSRENLKEKVDEAGGLSGKPLKETSTKIIKYIHKQMSRLPIIGVGGVFTAQDAYEKIKAGASLVQIYTGFIYEGPLIVKKINRDLAKLLHRDGFKNISEAVGAETI